MELSKNDSKMLQGLSVLAMVCLHLFDRDYTGLFTPLLFGGGGYQCPSISDSYLISAYLASLFSAAMPT